MSPSLPLSVNFHSSETSAGNVLSSADDVIYFSSYVELPRIDVDSLLSAESTESLRDATVFVDSDLPFVDAIAMLPSGQLVTISEITATLLADVENDRTIGTPSTVRAMEYLIPAMLAIVAVLFLPNRNRRDIAVLSAVVIAIIERFAAQLQRDLAGVDDVVVACCVDAIDNAVAAVNDHAQAVLAHVGTAPTVQTHGQGVFFGERYKLAVLDRAGRNADEDEFVVAGCEKERLFQGQRRDRECLSRIQTAEIEGHTAEVI